MAAPIRILVQTTIPTTDDDWSIARFSLLTSYLAAILPVQARRLPHRR